MLHPSPTHAQTPLFYGHAFCIPGTLAIYTGDLFLPLKKTYLGVQMHFHPITFICYKSILISLSI